jgi:hypothetical protein
VRLRAAASQHQNGRCYWCGILMRTDVAMNDPRCLTGEHLIPRSAGGETVAGNIVAACRRCNNGRREEQ